jgi:Regulator of chromosome condensation (RCC1) repeat/PASTA domain
VYQGRPRALCTSYKAGGTGQGGGTHGTHLAEVFMVRLKVAIAGAVSAGVLAGGLAMPPAASADTAQVVYAWGNNDQGEAGVDPNVAGDDAFSVDPDGSLWAWGDNQYGELGLGAGAPPLVRTPQKLPGLAGITQLAAGGGTSMALRSDGTLLVWGHESTGLRGDGIARTGNLPVPTPVTTVSGVTRIALSGSTALALAHAVTMPGVVGELGASALAELHALGLSVQELFVPDNQFCDNVGYVESQNPPPGTVVGPGTHVTIRVYVRPQGGCF